MSNDVIYEGDIIIINNKDKVSTSEDRVVLENGIPYFVTELGASKGNFYIKVYGKSILFFDTDMPNIEHIKIAERYDFKLDDYVVITNTSRVDNAVENDFVEGVNYKISKILEEKDIVITDGNKELWIKCSEMPYIKLVNEVKPNVAVVETEDNKNIQKLIDEALDCRDFKTLEKLVSEQTFNNRDLIK